jgi:hypothetical protein
VQHVATVFTCDMDGKAGALTVQLPSGLEIDLCPEHKSQLDGFLAPYRAAARKAVTAPRPRKIAPGVPAEQVRAWALRNGYPVANRGRVKHTVLAAYQAANQ